MLALCKDLILIIIMGIMYMGIEVLWRGFTSITMLPVGGLSAFLTGRINEKPAFYNKYMWSQCLIGTIMSVSIEFVSGLFFNVWLKLNIWDYSDMRWNVMGQICIPYAFLWYLLMPFCIYVDDYLRYRLFKQVKPLGIFYNYRRLFFLQ